MVPTSIITIVALAAAFISVACIIVWSAEAVKQHMVADRAHASGSERIPIGSSIVRNGVSWLKPCSNIILKNKKVERFFSEIIQLMGSKGYVSTPQNLSSLFCLGVLVSILAGTAMSRSPLVGVILALGIIVVSIVVLNQLKDKQKLGIREAVPDALRSMSACSHAGFSLQQTFHQVSDEIIDPLGSLFKKAAHDLDAGKTVSEALDTFRESAPVTELSFVAVALDVQHRAGGSLRQVLEAARESVENELELKRSLRVQTAQAKLSARIVSIMPFILIAVFSFLSPGFLDPFFSSFEGVALLALAIVMQAGGIFLVRRLLNVAVD